MEARGSWGKIERGQGKLGEAKEVAGWGEATGSQGNLGETSGEE
jgi:hypothetical protein